VEASWEARVIFGSFVPPLWLGGIRGKQSTPSVWLGGTGELSMVGERDAAQSAELHSRRATRQRYAHLFY
jgi:hypothetical protein